MWVGSPERPRLTASGSSSTAGLWSLRLQLAPGWGVCVCVCVCVCKLSPEDGHRALGMGSPWPGSLLTPANRAWAFLVPPTHPPTSCWQRSGHVLLQPLTQARVIWKSS